MSAHEIAAGLRFVVDAKGRVTSVVLTPELWRRLVDQIDAAEDRNLLRECAPKLRHGPGRAMRWRDLSHEWH